MTTVSGIKMVTSDFETISSMFGFILNCTSLYLIYCKTDRFLKEYRPILLQNCLIETFFNITNFFTKTVSFFK